MEPATRARAIAAGVDAVEAAGMRVDDAIVLNDSNRLTLRLSPPDVIARVAPRSHAPIAGREVELARRLGEADAPIGPLDPRFAPRVHGRGEFVVSHWVPLESVGPADVDCVDPVEFATALAELHDAMRRIDLTALVVPHALDRVAEARALLDDHTNNAAIGSEDRELLAAVLERSSALLTVGGTPQQPLHGEPHPGNVIRTAAGLRFVDFETCCVGPVEFDLAHAATDASGPPVDVANAYPDADEVLVRDCWMLSRALATAWRCDPADDLPDGARRARTWLAQLRRSAK